MTPEQIIAEWQRAYQKASAKPAPKVTYTRGWFEIDGACPRYQRSRMIQLTKNLVDRSRERK